MKVEPQKQHAWLQRLVGEWTSEFEACMKPGEPPIKLHGREIVRPVGDVWIIGEGEGEMPGGGTSHTMLTLGFDPETRRFVGAWIGSMMTHLWIYNGSLDAEERVLTLECEGPKFDGTGGTTKYKDIYKVVSDHERILTGNILGPDGTWSEMMTATYRRVR